MHEVALVLTTFFITKCPTQIMDNFEDDLSFICWNDNFMTHQNKNSYNCQMWS